MAYEILKPEWSRPVRGVLFDMDGLVLDTEKLYTRYWMEACHAFGFPMTRAQALRMRSADRIQSRQNLQEFFGPEADYFVIHRKRVELMNAFIAQYGVEAKPGIDQLLDALDQREIARAITSSSPLERIRTHLGSLGLDARFDTLCSGHDMPRGKPEPDIYLFGAASLNLPPEACLALEDSPAGIISAYRAGCLPVMIPDQDEPGEEILPLLYARADSLADVIALLDPQT